MWLTSSSIGRKFVMALTGICLVLFVTFHCLMNTVAIFWPAAYNQICMFLGANWYALVASAGLAVLFIIHIFYACWLTIQNRSARGNSRYAVTSLPPHVEWSSKNMFVLGIVIFAFLIVHLIQFWAKMQLMDMLHTHAEITMPVATAEGVSDVTAPAPGEFGTLFLQAAFQCIWTPIVYIVGFVALWFHMNHGFWSMFHTIGWDNNIWIKRLKVIGCIWTSIVVLLFIAQAVAFTVFAHKGEKSPFLADEKVQEQYAEYWDGQAAALVEEFNAEMSEFQQKMYMQQMAGMPVSEDQSMLEALQIFKGYYPRFEEMANALKVMCPTSHNENVQTVIRYADAMKQQIDSIEAELGAKASRPQTPAAAAVVVEDQTVVEE